MVATPSLPRLAATALPATPEAHDSTPSSWAKVARVAVAQLAWAAAAAVTGVAGIGGAATHIALGLSLVPVLVWTARLLGPARLPAPGMRAMTVLAAVGAAVALVARSERVGAALVAHVVLAALLLAGLASIARAAWRRGHQPVPLPA